MSDMAIDATRERGKSLPKPILLGAAALIGFALVASSFARVSDVGTLHMTRGAAVETLSLRFDDRADGAIVVSDASDDKTIYVVAPGTNGFIRGTLRGLAQERLRSDVSSQIPFALTHWSDGTLSLEDPSNHRAVALEAFGPTNAQAFAQLFAARKATR